MVNDINTIAEDTRAAFATGRTTNIEWRRNQLKAIKTMLREQTERIEAAMYEDLGKHRTDAFVTEVAEVHMEINHILKHLDKWTRDRRVRSVMMLAPTRAYICHEPLGTVLIIAPWNYPIHLILMPMVGAIAAGNTVVVKPSELAPACSKVMAEILPKYLDSECVKVVEGGVEETTQLLDQRWDHIFYTGNGAVGRIVATAAAKHLTPVTLELGGKSPVWYDPSYSADLAARWLVWGKTSNAGQTCVAPDYVLAPKGSATQLAEAFKKEVERVFGPDPQKSADYSRIINERHVERLQGLLAKGRCVVGGQVDLADRYVAPTVLVDVELTDPVMSEEIFGPILPIVEVEDHHHAIKIINDREKPLAMYGLTDDDDIKRDLLERTSSGGLAFGTVMLHLGIPALPFGGVGASGTGSYHGEHSFLAFSHERAVLYKGRGPDTAAIGRAPFTARKDALLRRQHAG